jgi:hypothetical protein
MTRFAIPCTAAALAVGLIAQPAAASILVTPVPKSSERCISVQFWYRNSDGGPRTARVSVTRNGHVVARRTIKVASKWRDYELACPGTGTYKTKITTADWSATYRTKIVARRSG